jgi:hypothetical protein
MNAEPTWDFAIDMQALALAGLPPEHIADGLNSWCWTLDSELLSDFPDQEQRARTVLEAASAVCTRLGQFQSAGIGHA